MKIIKLNESQMSRIFEANIESDEEYGNKGVITTSVQSKDSYIYNQKDDKHDKHSDQPWTDDIVNKETPQAYSAMRNNGRNYNF